MELHTASGALGGGWSGAAGAAVSGASVDLMQALQDNLQQGLEAAGLGDGAAKGLAQSIATLTAAGMGAAVGGAYGAANAATVDANNRQLHPTERKKAEELSKKSGGRYTQQQIEDAMRNSGNSARGENITAGMVLDTACITGVGQQQSAPLTQQTKEAIADAAEATSRGAGVIAAGATAVAAGASPQVKPIAGAVALGATAVGAGADAVEQVVRPDLKQVFREQLLLGVPADVLTRRYPIYAPIINEVRESLQ